MPPGGGLALFRDSFPDVEIVVATGDEFIEALPDADAAVAWSMTPEEFAAATKLRWFQSIGAGVERVLLPGMRERGLVVTNTSGMHATNISEHLLGMMLAFARRFPFLIRAQVEGVWRDDEGRRGVFELAGQTLLVVGFGDIGQALARKAAALDMRVLAVNRRGMPVDPGGVERIGSISELPELLSGADHVAICLPQTKDTAGLFDAAMLARMKRGAYLYNIGRGPIVDTGALIDALDRGAIGGAGLDVTDPEPLPSNSPLWQRDNVMITAHTSGASPLFWPRLFNIISENFRRYRSGERLMNVVDFDAGY